MKLSRVANVYSNLGNVQTHFGIFTRKDSLGRKINRLLTNDIYTKFIKPNTYILANLKYYNNDVEADCYFVEDTIKNMINTMINYNLIDTNYKDDFNDINKLILKFNESEEEKLYKKINNFKSRVSDETDSVQNSEFDSKNIDLLIQLLVICIYFIYMLYDFVMTDKVYYKVDSNDAYNENINNIFGRLFNEYANVIDIINKMFLAKSNAEYIEKLTFNKVLPQQSIHIDVPKSDIGTDASNSYIVDSLKDEIKELNHSIYIKHSKIVKIIDEVLNLKIHV